MTLFIIITFALLLDWLFAEPAHYHPLVGYGRYVKWLENIFYQSSKRAGGIAWCLAVLPIVFVLYILLIILPDFLYVLASILLLYFSIGWRSLLQHAKAIIKPLTSGDLSRARHEVAKIVSRDTNELDEQGIAKAATESVLENGADAVFATIFWFAIFGPIGAVGYRLINTLDAMWGYKSSHYINFGWVAARLDDVVNYIPARLTALSYALVGRTKLALQCWRDQGHRWKSPNAGPVMAAGAGAINTSLGGAAIYHGQAQNRMVLGMPLNNTTQANSETITAACQLLNRALGVWLLVILIISNFE